LSIDSVWLEGRVVLLAGGGPKVLVALVCEQDASSFAHRNGELASIPKLNADTIPGKDLVNAGRVRSK